MCSERNDHPEYDLISYLHSAEQGEPLFLPDSSDVEVGSHWGEGKTSVFQPYFQRCSGYGTESCHLIF